MSDDLKKSRDAPLYPQSIGTEQEFLGKFPFDAWEFDPPGTVPVDLTQRTGYRFNVTGDATVGGNLGVTGRITTKYQELKLTDHPTDGDEAIPNGAELFELNTPDLVSSLGRPPLAGANFVWLPARLTENGVPSYDNQWNKWTGRGTIGVFKATTNLVKDSEDLTAGNWGWGGNGSSALSDKYFQGRRFTLLTSTANSGRCAQTISFTGNGVKAVQCLLMRNTDEDDTGIRIRDGSAAANRLEITLDWSTKTFTETTGSIVSQKWYGDEIVEVLMITTAVTAANSNNVEIRPSVAGTGSVYATAVQVENSAYPTPYTPTSRAAGDLDYPFSVAQAGALELWVRPWWAYDDGSNHQLIVLGTDAAPNSFLSLWYNAADDKFYCWLSDGTNRVGRKSATAYNNGGTGGLNQLWTWIHFKVAYNASAKTLQLWVNGVEESTTDNSGTLGAWSPASALLLGARAANTNPLDGLITDLCIWGSADTSTTHYTGNRPYYDAARLLGENCEWRLP